MAEDDQDVDIQAILARINSNIEDDEDNNSDKNSEDKADQDETSYYQKYLNENAEEQTTNNDTDDTSNLVSNNTAIEENLSQQQTQNAEAIENASNVPSDENQKHESKEMNQNGNNPSPVPEHKDIQQQQESMDAKIKQESEETNVPLSQEEEYSVAAFRRELAGGDNSSQGRHDIDDDEYSPDRKDSTASNLSKGESLMQRIAKIKNQILTVRDEAEDETTEEALTEQSRGITMSTSILKSAGVRQTAIDHEQLQIVIDAIGSIYANNFSTITNKQNEIFDTIKKIRAQSDLTSLLYEQKLLGYGKLTNVAQEKMIADVRTVADSSEKTREALYLLVQRLEELETVIDYKIEARRLVRKGELQPHGSPVLSPQKNDEAMSPKERTESGELKEKKGPAIFRLWSAK